MATQAETLSHIKSSYQCEELDGGILKLILVDSDGRSQLAFIHVDEYKMQVMSPFAKTSQITDSQAIDICESSVLGVGKLGDLYVVKNAVPIADLDPSEVTVGIENTMLMADGFEKELGLGDDL
jgi:hypothetical protein